MPKMLCKFGDIDPCRLDKFTASFRKPWAMPKAWPWPTTTLTSTRARAAGHAQARTVASKRCYGVRAPTCLDLTSAAEAAIKRLPQVQGTTR